MLTLLVSCELNITYEKEELSLYYEINYLTYLKINSRIHLLKTGVKIYFILNEGDNM